MKAVNIKEKLANVRETCRGYSEYTYRFVDYVAENLTGLVGPVGLAAAALSRVKEIKSGCDEDGNTLPPYFITNKDEILGVAWQFLQVIDVVTDDEFAERFRELCERILEWDALKRLTVADDDDYPECIKVALDWWTGAIQAGRAYTGPYYDSEREETTYRRLTAEELKTFRRVLAKDLMDSMKVCHGGAMIEVDSYNVRSSLEGAFETLGLSYKDQNVPPIHHSLLGGYLQMEIEEDYILLWLDDPEPIGFLWWKED